MELETIFCVELTNALLCAFVCSTNWMVVVFADKFQLADMDGKNNCEDINESDEVTRDTYY